MLKGEEKISTSPSCNAAGLRGAHATIALLLLPKYYAVIMLASITWVGHKSSLWDVQTLTMHYGRIQIYRSIGPMEPKIIWLALWQFDCLRFIQPRQAIFLNQKYLLSFQAAIKMQIEILI